MSSDVVISVQPSLAADSEFSSHLKRFASRKDRGIVAATEDTVPEVSVWRFFSPGMLVVLVVGVLCRTYT